MLIILVAYGARRNHNGQPTPLPPRRANIKDEGVNTAFPVKWTAIELAQPRPAATRFEGTTAFSRSALYCPGEIGLNARLW